MTTEAPNLSTMAKFYVPSITFEERFLCNLTMISL